MTDPDPETVAEVDATLQPVVAEESARVAAELRALTRLSRKVVTLHHDLQAQLKLAQERFQGTLDTMDSADNVGDSLTTRKVIQDSLAVVHHARLELAEAIVRYGKALRDTERGPLDQLAKTLEEFQQEHSTDTDPGQQPDAPPGDSGDSGDPGADTSNGDGSGGHSQ